MNEAMKQPQKEKENIKVMVRIRPLLESEKGQAVCLRVNNKVGLVFIVNRNYKS